RQLGDEADRVGQQHLLATRQHDAAGERVQRREKLLLGYRPSLGEAVEQRALARVRVTNQRDDRHAGAFARRALTGAVHANALDLDLRLTGSAPHANAADLPLQVSPCASQPRQQVLQACQLYLHTTFVRTRALGKDVQDQQRAIDDAATQDLLHRALGVGRELIIDDDQVGMRLAGAIMRLLELAPAQVRARIWVLEPLRQPSNDLGAGGASQLFEF